MAQAYEDFKVAVAEDSNHPDVYCHRGQLHLLQNDYSQARWDDRTFTHRDAPAVARKEQLFVHAWRSLAPQPWDLMQP